MINRITTIIENKETVTAVRFFFFMYFPTTREINKKKKKMISLTHSARSEMLSDRISGKKVIYRRVQNQGTVKPLQCFTNNLKKKNFKKYVSVTVPSSVA